MLRRMKKRVKGKKGFAIVWGPLIFWIIALIVLALGIVLAVVLKGKGDGALGFLKNLFRFKA